MTPVASSLPNQAGSSFAPQASQPGPVAHGRPSGGIHQGGQSAPYSLNEILALLGFAGYRGQPQANMAAIAMAESGGDPNATHTNADGSVDRGLFQINSRWHPEVSDACAYDPVCSAHQAAAIEKSSGWGAWSTWTNGSASGWLVQAEAAQKKGTWKRFTTEFANDRLSQANAGQGTPGSASSQALVGSKSGMLFNCSGGAVSHYGPIITGYSLPAIGCYMESAFIFTMYAVGGLILVGAGVLLLMHKNPVSVGLKGTMLAGGAASAAGKRALASRLPPEEPAPATGLAADREARIASQAERRLNLAEAEAARKAEAAANPPKKKKSSRDKLDEAKAYEARARGYAIRKAAKEGPDITRPISILGVQIPSFDAPGVDPTRMKG